MKDKSIDEIIIDLKSVDKEEALKLINAKIEYGQYLIDRYGPSQDGKDSLFQQWTNIKELFLKPKCEACNDTGFIDSKELHLIGECGHCTIPPIPNTN